MMKKQVQNIAQIVSNGQSIAINPLDSIMESTVKLCITLLIPIPYAAELAVKLKGPIITLLINTLLSILLVLATIIFMLTRITPTQANSESTTIPTDGSFISTDIPLQNPLGGQGLSLVRITAGFMDPNYTFFGGVHTGVDFVPNDRYYQTNTQYKQTGDVIVYDTLNGKVNYYTDQYGSHTVEVVSKNESIKTIDMHLNKVFVTSNQTITAGTPIGTMGDTGFTTGEHLHYEIRTKNNEIWTPVNPLGYIK